MAYGIDLGSSAVKVVSIRRSLRGWKVTSAARRRVPAVEGEELKKALLRSTYEAVGGGNGARRAGVVGLSGRDINLQVVQQPNMKPVNYRVMMSYELEQRKGQATDLYLDYCTLREPDQYFPQYLALIGIGKSAFVDERVELLTRSSVDVRDAVPNAFALYEVHRNAYGVEGGTVLLLDIGANNMDLAFVRGGRLIFARNVSSGAGLFDNNISNMTGASAAEAEALKIQHGTLGPGASDGDEESLENQVRAGIRTAAGQLAGFVTASINHAKMQLNDRELAVDRIYLSGGGARLAGLPQYLAGSLKIEVEVLDPFRKVDTTALQGAGEDDFRRLPTDMAVAIGLAQLANPAGGPEPLSILPDAIRKRRNFMRTWLWMGAGAAVLVLSLIIQTVAAYARSSSESEHLAQFRKATKEVSADIEKMDALEKEAIEANAKADWLMSLGVGGRALLDTLARLHGVMPPGVSIRKMELVDPPGQDRDDRVRVAFRTRTDGLVIGDRVKEDEESIRLRGHEEPYPMEAVIGDVLHWPGESKAVLIAGEVDENAKGGPVAVINELKDKLSDEARGVTVTVLPFSKSPKPGWRRFQIVVSAR